MITSESPSGVLSTETHSWLARPSDRDRDRNTPAGRVTADALEGGHARIGDTLHVPVDGTLVAVEVTGSVLVDPEGARRDG